MRRFFRVIFKLGLLAAIGIGVALAVKKLTAPPPLPDELEPWPPINTDPPVVDDLVSGRTNGDASESEAAATSSN